MITFSDEPLQNILLLLQNTLSSNGRVSFRVLNPDIADEYAGKHIKIGERVYLYRGYKAWINLAEILKAKMKTPKVVAEHLVEITYVQLDTDSFHQNEKDQEKYGINSHFAQIHKMEEPAFLHYYLQALQNVNVAKRTDILDLGINSGDEFGVIRNLLHTNEYEKLNLTGIDYSCSAIAHAKEKYPETNTHFYIHDINELNSLKLGKFDLLISIGTLQVTGIHFKPYFMHLIQNYMKKDAAIILGFPNSRWIGGEMIYGAKAPNYAMSEMSILFNDVIFCKKYLQQKKYRVTITGKHYIFLTATKIN